MFGLFKSKKPTVIPKDDQGKILSITAKGSKFIIVGQFKHPQTGWQDFRKEIRSGIVGFNGEPEKNFLRKIAQIHLKS